jgi:hypothetical protein
MFTLDCFCFDMMICIQHLIRNFHHTLYMYIWCIHKLEPTFSKICTIKFDKLTLQFRFCFDAWNTLVIHLTLIVLILLHICSVTHIANNLWQLAHEFWYNFITLSCPSFLLQAQTKRPSWTAQVKPARAQPKTAWASPFLNMNSYQIYLFSFQLCK